ncbi:MAG: 2Fe-2S iron-sulfur cluster binding domain-containing protein [Rhodanobacter sp.]|nr:2Fe-2S iron-sulfur cluster binding domain-containing protein [Rhodanobacter sp.]
MILDTGESCVCKGNESVLHALVRARKRIPTGCRGGGCGVCKVEVVAGSYSKRAMSRAHVSETEEAERRVLACCIYPTADLQLRIIGKLQRAVCRPKQAGA